MAFGHAFKVDLYRFLIKKKTGTWGEKVNLNMCQLEHVIRLEIYFKKKK